MDIIDLVKSSAASAEYISNDNAPPLASACCTYCGEKLVLESNICQACSKEVDEIPPKLPPLSGPIAREGPEPGVDGVYDVPMSELELTELSYENSGKYNLQIVRKASGKNFSASESPRAASPRASSIASEDSNDDLRFLSSPERGTLTSSMYQNALSGDDRESHRRKIEFYAPPDHMDMVYGYVERYRGKNITSFQFRREADGKFILGATMRADLTGIIVIHTLESLKDVGDVKDIPRGEKNPYYIAALVQNFLGTQFVLHDYRVANPTADSTSAGAAASSTGNTQAPTKPSKPSEPIYELALLQYEVNIFGRVPNSLRACFPRWDERFSDAPQRMTLLERLADKNQRRAIEGKTLVERIRTNNEKEYAKVDAEEKEEIFSFDTAKPSWSEEMNAWTLNFNGRVQIASKKNILLTPARENETMDEEFGADTVCVRFGKFTKHRFSLDYRHPVSVVQAFSVALSTFARKKVVT